MGKTERCSHTCSAAAGKKICFSHVYMKFPLYANPDWPHFDSLDSWKPEGALGDIQIAQRLLKALSIFP